MPFAKKRTMRTANITLQMLRAACCRKAVEEKVELTEIGLLSMLTTRVEKGRVAAEMGDYQGCIRQCARLIVNAFQLSSYIGNDINVAIKQEIADYLPESASDAHLQTNLEPTLNLNDLAEKINQANRNNGLEFLTVFDWAERPNVYKILVRQALVHSQVSAASQAVQENDIEKFTNSCADTLLQVLDITGGLGLDVQGAVEKKLAARSHGTCQHEDGSQ